MEIRTTRLLLREYRADDFERLRTIHGNSEVQTMRGRQVFSEQETRDEIEVVLAAQQATPRTHYQWIIERQSDQGMVGYCRLTITHSLARNATIGYFLHHSAWGLGYATEVAQAMLKFGFMELDLHRIGAGCIATNMGSKHVLEKIGMKLEGYLREEQWFNQQWYDTCLFAILKQEYTP